MSRLELPFDIRDVTPEEDGIIKKFLTDHSRTFVKCGTSEYIMPGMYKEHAQAIYNVEVRPDDVWVIGFPRSGTTWTQELVWLIQNNLDFATAKQKPLHERFSMLELTTQIPDKSYEKIKEDFMNSKKFQGLGEAIEMPSWENVERQKSPRFIKSHMPLSLLPPTLLKIAKVIYVARDPRDVAVSYYYNYKMIFGDTMRHEFKMFWDAFRRDLFPWSPIVAHTNEAWMRRHDPNLLFIFYEDMSKDLPKEIRKVCKFLGKDYTDEEIKRLADHLRIDNMRKMKTVNNTLGQKADDIQFIRKGGVGGWKAYFDKEMEIQSEKFLVERLRGLDLVYPTFKTEETTVLLKKE